MTTYDLLGPIRVLRGGVPVDLGGPKQRAVLAALLLDVGRVVSADRLVDAVWGRHPPGNTAASLQAYVSNLRRALREETLSASPIIRRNPGYLIDVDPHALDTTRFDAGCERTRRLVDDSRWSEAVAEAERSLTLWRGPLAQDFGDQDWVAVAAPAYEERRLTCEQDLVTALLGEGRVPDALGRAASLVRSHPLDERAYWLYVLALHRSGRTADALATLASFAKTLDEELGLEPGPALRDLQGAILRLEADLEVWPSTLVDGTVPGVVEPSTAVGRGALLADEPQGPPLIGRAPELATVAAAWRTTPGHGSPWVLVTGPAGIGKSRFADEAAAAWRRARGHHGSSGPLVVRVSCPDDEALPAWWAVRQLLRGLGADADGVLASSDGSDVEVTRFAVYERASAHLLRVASERGLLVFIDDVHWADPSTMGLLVHLAETSHDGVPWLLTARDEIESGEGARLISALARRPGAVQVTLPPLTTEEISDLVEQVSGNRLDQDEVAALAERTSGNAFFVTEYARLPRSERTAGELPLAVRSVIERRLRVLGPSALAVLRAAAVIGEPLDLDVLRMVCGLDDESLADALDAAGDAYVLVPSGSSYTFAHALLREALASDLSPIRAQSLHQRIAEVLQGRLDSESLARRAQHLLLAGDGAETPVVVQACLAIARDADRRWDAGEAVRWWEAALRAHDRAGSTGSDERDDLVVSFLAALVRAGQGQRMLSVVDSSLLEAWREGRTSSVGRVASILLRLTGAWPWPAYGSHPSALLSRLAGLESQLREHPSTHARVLAVMAIGSCYDMDPAVADTLSQRAIDIAESTEDADALADALLGRAILYGGVIGRAQETLALLDRLTRLRHRQERFDEVIAHGVASKTTIAQGDLAATITHVDTGAALAERLRLPVSRAQFRWAEYALAAWQSEDLDATERLIDAAYHQHQQTELTQSVSVVFARLCVRWAQGRLAEGVGRVENPYIAPWVTAVVAAARGDDDAADLLRIEITRPEPTVWTSHGRWTLLGHAVADIEASHLADHVVPHLASLRGAVGSLGHVAVLGPVDLARARVHLCSGDLDAAESALQDATETATRAQSVTWLLRCRVLGFELASRRGLPTVVGSIDRVRAEAHARGLLGVVHDLDRLIGGAPGDV